MQLTTHFALEELTFSSTAQRMGLDNAPGEGVRANLLMAAQGMEKIRTLLGSNPIHIDSGYRCEALERVLCVKDFINYCARHRMIVNDASWPLYFRTKAHPKGFAVDFTCDAFGTPEQIVKAIVASGLKFDQCIQEGTWVHVSFDPAMRQQVLTATFGPQGPTYTQGA